MKVTIKEITEKRDLRQFVHFPNAMYKNEPYYVPTLESADLDMLNPKKNHAFEVCEAAYWMAFDENGKAVGRIAAIINHRYNEKMGIRQTRFGFMDFIDDNDVVDALFETVTNWSEAMGMTSLSGPVGFLEFDAAGVLVEGYDKLPTAYGKYNYPYYADQLSRIGFRKETDWVESIITIPNPIPDKYEKAARIVAERYHLHPVKIENKKQMSAYFDEVADLLNRTYSKLHGYSELTVGQVQDLKDQFVPNLDPDLVSIIKDSQDKIIAFIIWMPSLAKAMQKCGGKLFPFGFIHVLRALKHNDTVDSLLIGIDDEYKQKGVSAMLLNELSPALKKRGIKYIETTRQLEDNKSVQNLYDKFESKLVKRARCYCKEI